MLTKRIDFKRQRKSENMNLIIFNFEGVIGDVYKTQLFDPAAVTYLFFRHGLAKSLRQL
jgi:hypothetical protein